MKDLAERGKMEDEAKEMRQAKMRQKCGHKVTTAPHVCEQKSAREEEEAAELKRKNQMVGLLTNSILKKDGIDELFEGHLESEGEEPVGDALTAMAVKLDAAGIRAEEEKTPE